MTRTIPTCERCGDELETADVKTWADEEPVTIVTSVCDCPGPRCPCCEHRLVNGRCDYLGCFVYGRRVPLPEMW